MVCLFLRMQTNLFTLYQEQAATVLSEITSGMISVIMAQALFIAFMILPNHNYIMFKAKAINRKKLVAFVLNIIRKEKFPMSEKLKKLKHEQYFAEQKLRSCQHREKILERQMSELNRRERVHRLCTRAGMLESFLVCPGELTDDQVMKLLKISFRQPEVVLALAKMVHDVHERSNVQNPLE